jgi:hypothetical protein
MLSTIQYIIIMYSSVRRINHVHTVGKYTLFIGTGYALSSLNKLNANWGS